MSVCSDADCARPAWARGLCSMHYQRWWKRKNPRDLMKANGTMPIEERLTFYGWDVTETGCWEWRGSRISAGYGQLEVKGKGLRAHRVAYETWVSPIPEGMVVRHKCDNPPCINPDHLELGTQKDNGQDMASRGRSTSGDKNVRAKLTWEKVREIRSLAGAASQSELARRFEVNPSVISNIIRNRTWREPQIGELV